MKGKILGFHEADGTGAISSEDGSRHRFSRADWRGERPPAAGMAVDFESDGGAAKDVYPVGGNAMSAISSFSVDFSGLSANSDGTKLARLFTQSLAVPLALVVLFACFANALTTPMQSASLLGLGQTLDQLAMAASASEMMGSGNSGFGTVQAMMVLRYAAPLTAIWLIATAWLEKNEKLPMLAAGVSAILAALLVMGLKSAVISLAPDFLRDRLSAGIGLGLGVWLLLLSGAALLAAGFDKLRNPFAKG